MKLYIILLILFPVWFHYVAIKLMHDGKVQDKYDFIRGKQKTVKKIEKKIDGQDLVRHRGGGTALPERAYAPQR